MNNTPVEIDMPNNFSFDLYLFRFLTNFYSLFINDFDPRLDDCKKNHKTDLFNFYLKEMIKISDKFNQKLVFITFNLKEDLIKKPTWRYNKIKNALEENNIIVGNKEDLYSSSLAIIDIAITSGSLPWIVFIPIGHSIWLIW